MFEPVRDGQDILVDNAASNPPARIADTTAGEFHRVMTVDTTFPPLAVRGGRHGGARRLPDHATSTSDACWRSRHAPCHAGKAALEQVTTVAPRNPVRRVHPRPSYAPRASSISSMCSSAQFSNVHTGSSRVSPSGVSA